MKYKKQIIILMVILMLFHTLTTPFKTNAVAIPIGVTMGGAAKAFLAFIMASTAVGVTYSTIEDAKKSFGTISGLSDEGLADWIFGYNSPFEPPTPPPDNMKWYDILGLGFVGGAVTQQLNDFINQFKEYFGEVEEGENVLLDGNGVTDLTNYPYSTTIGNYNLNVSHINQYFWINNNLIHIWTEQHSTNNDYWILNGQVNNEIVKKKALKKSSNTSGTFTIVYPGDVYYFNLNNDYIRILSSELTEGTIPKPTQNIISTYYITNNAPILNPVQNPPPDKVYLPYLPTLDPDNDKIKEIYLPTGDKRLIYDGTEEDYYLDIVNNIDLDQLQDPDLKVGEVTIIDGQIVIDIPIDNPFPNPDLEPNPELPENEQDIIPWIQVVINWISQTKNSIDNIITPPEEYIPPELDLTPFSNIVILDKFPFSLPWDLKRVIETLTSKDTEAPLFEVDFPIEVSSVNWKQDVKFDLDFDRFTPLANIMRTMLSLIFVLGLIIVTRRFIGGA